MNAKVCPFIPSEYTHASTFEMFFKEDEVVKIRRLFDPREQIPITSNTLNCKTNLFFGFFFDGTKNNYTLAGKNKTQSNIARLYDCYPGQSVPGVLPGATNWDCNTLRYKHFFRTYIPGVASPFDQINDTGQGIDLQLGQAAGYLGGARIAWALLQAINNVHRFFMNASLLTPDEMKSLARSIRLEKHYRNQMSPTNAAESESTSGPGCENTRVTFTAILARLHGALSQHWPDKRSGRPKKIEPGIVQKIHVSIFGFSRGATQSRAFTNWLIALCRLDAYLCGKPRGMTLGGFDVVFDFLGIFDTVASVGPGNTLGNSLPGRIFDGHGIWADAEENLRIPPEITCLHLVAAHEIRRSFPLDSVAVRGVTPSNCTEIVFPGVHSDIGCGYAPGEQGRGIHPYGDDMMTRIPLLVMYHAARLAGVPLKLELAPTNAQKRFAVTPETIKVFNAYISACTTKSGSLTDIMREQANYYMQWRLLRRNRGDAPVDRTESYGRASAFDQNDLRSANIEFETEITRFTSWLQSKGPAFIPSAQKPGFDDEHENEWKEIAMWWKAPPKLDPAIAYFFDNYVHDSRAWFKPIPGNPSNEAEAVVQLKEWDAKRTKFIKDHAEVSRRLALTPQVAVKQRARQNVQRGPIADGLTDAQRDAAEEYARTQKIPSMITYGREPFESTSASWYLSSRGGYLRYRKIYGGSDGYLMSALDAVDEQETKVA